MRRLEIIQTRQPSWMKDYQSGIRKEVRRAKRLQRKNKQVVLKIKIESRRLEGYERAKQLRVNATASELHFKKILDDLHIRHIFQYVYFFSPLQYRIIDFYLHEYKINIEIDGSAHDCSQEYDKMKDDKTRFPVLRIPNQRIFEPNFKEWFLKYLKCYPNVKGR